MPACFRTIAAVLAVFSTCLASHFSAQTGPQRSEQVWLVVSDIHLDIFDRSPHPSPNGVDANEALFESALSQMKRAARNPAVILLPGDFLMHDFARAVGHHAGTPEEAAIRTMRWIASRLNSAFPKAQFAIALGNNDIPCGDYKSADGSAYLAALARIWTPLQNRNGAAPNFGAAFPRGGYYTARLPVPGLRLVVLNTVLLSSQYMGNCGGHDYEAASDELAWLTATLRTTPSGTRNVLMMHIPPGFDAYATEYVHDFLVWPFLSARYDAALVTALAASGDRVTYAIAGHTHRFDFRITGSVPVVVLGSLSPIYGNNPAFYALRILPNGALRDIDAYTFDEPTQTWLHHSFDQTWGDNRIDASSLTRLHARLANAPAMRAVWGQQADGWPSDSIGAGGAWGENWRVSWCAQSLLIPNFAKCAGIEQRVWILPLLVFVIIAVVATLILAANRRARMRTG